MKFRKFVIIVLTLLNVLIISAQDIHWSQFNDNPIFQNPANCGDFKGDYRFIANYRNQWKSVTTPFTTFNLSADGHFSKYKNLSYGLLLFNDVAGDGKFRTIEFQGNLSYKLNVTSSDKHVIRTGINFGMNHRQINFNLLSFDNQYNGMYYDASLPNNENYATQKNTNLSIGIGANYTLTLSKKESYTFGIGSFNLNKPNQGFYNTIEKRDIRTNLFIKGKRNLKPDLDLIPSIQFNLQGKYKELILGSSLKYTLIEKPTEYRAVYAGLWFRNRDAFYITGGIDYQNWFFGLSYDVNVSKLVPASNFRGGIEFALRYIIFSFKPKKVIHRICPDYI